MEKPLTDYDNKLSNIKDIYTSSDIHNKIIGRIINNTGFTITMWINIDSLSIQPEKMALFSSSGYANITPPSTYSYRVSNNGFHLYLQKNTNNNNYKLSVKDNRETSANANSVSDRYFN